MSHGHASVSWRENHAAVEELIETELMRRPAAWLISHTIGILVVLRTDRYKGPSILLHTGIGTVRRECRVERNEILHSAEY